MTNEEKINLIGQKILILSNNLDNYQAELKTLKLQLQQLQQQQSQTQQNFSFKNYSPSAKEVIITPEPKPEVIKPEIPKVEVPDISTKLPFIEEEIIPADELTDSEIYISETYSEEIPQPVEIEEPVVRFNQSIYGADLKTQTVPNIKPPVIRTPPPPKKKNETWEKLEKQFAENWTGILGSVIMVIGVGFLGIYAALKVSALGRFMLISGFSGVLGALFFLLRKKELWLKLALWLRSSAGAIFLFACVGLYGIPGLQWTGSETTTLLILFLGILTNLFLGYIGGKESFASLHVLLSLAGVMVIAPSPLSLIVGGIVALFGVALTYREKWDYHLLLTISSFFAFHLYYRLSQQHDISQEERITGIVTVLVMGLAVALVHYRKAYSSKQFDRVPFSVHLINWFYFGFGLFLYSNGSRLSTIFLAVGALTAFLLAQRAKKLEIGWLYRTDTLIAQLTALIALATLYKWEVDAVVILTAVFAEGLLFLFIAQKENDSLLYKVGSIVINIAGVLLLLKSLISINYTDQTLIINHALSVLTAGITGTAFLVYSNRTNNIDVSGLFKIFGIEINEKTKHPVLGIILGGLFISFSIHVYHFNWAVYAVVALLIAVLFLRYKIQSIELAFVSVILLTGEHIINWNQLFTEQQASPVQLLSLGLPLIAASVLSARWSFVNSLSKHINWLGVYLCAIQLILLSYYLLYPVSYLAPGAAWLFLSVAAIVKAKFISKSKIDFHKADRYILHAGYILIALFLFRFLFIHLQSQEMWGPLKSRIWVDFYAVSVFVFWAVMKKPEASEYKSWTYLHPLFLELILLFSFLNTTVEIDYTLLPLVWLGSAFAVFILGSWKHASIGRLHVYSFLLFIISIFQEITVYNHSWSYTHGLPGYSDLTFILALVYMVLSFTFLLLFYKRAILSSIEWPQLLKFMKPVTDALSNYAPFLGIYLFTAFILFLSYLMFTPISAIIPGVLWLLLSAVAATLAVYLNNKPSNFIGVDRYILHSGYLFLAAFLLRHLFVHIQMEEYCGPVKTRLLIELGSLAVFVYWASLKKPEGCTYKSWEYLHPLFIELIVLFSILTASLEVPGIIQPLIWIAIAFAMALLGNFKHEKFSRLLFYSIVLYWIAAFQTAFVTGFRAAPSSEILDQPWIYGTASVLFQFIFLAYFYMKCSLENMLMPKSLEFLNPLVQLVNKRRNVFVFYPLIFCTAVFLYWTFDNSILTLLWVVECAAVFVLSILLKEQHFRYIALGALALAIIRLLFYDMAQAGTLNRALVFVGVGIIMLGMNSLYNKYKGRFE